MGHPSHTKAAAPRTRCEVCGRSLRLLRDGTVRDHKPRPRTKDAYAEKCGGSGHRQARWPAGQLLIHHTGAVFEVAEDRAPRTPHRDYLIRCVSVERCASSNEREGRELVVHGEYMHRDGWRPVEEGRPPKDEL